jgi:hypothetical protein
MNITEMQWQLDLLASSACLDITTAKAARHASELLRAFRAGLDLNWKTNAADLHGLAQNITSIPATAPPSER